MQPSEIQQLAEAVVRAQSGYLPLYALLSILAAGLSAFFGAYLKAKAEAKASKEQFDALLDQLRITTKETEEIKQYLGGKAWRSQQQWTAREKYYTELLNSLHRISVTLDDLAEYFHDPGSQHVRDEEHGPRFRELMNIVASLLKGLRDLMGPGELYLSAATVESLKKMQVEHWDLVNYEANCSAEYVFGAQKLVQAAHSATLRDAKHALGLADA